MHWTLLESQTNAINPPNQWALIVLAAFTILYVVFIRPARKAKTKDPLEHAPLKSNLAQQRSIERDMANLLVEYEEMIRRMTAQVDTRAARLEMLIAEADEKVAALRAAQRAASDVKPSSGNGAAHDGNPAPVAGPEATDPRAPHEPAREDDPVDPRHAEIYELADRGRTARQIAQELNRQDAEVNLILALRQGRS